MNTLSEEAKKVQEQRTVQVWMSRLKPNSAKTGLWILVPFEAWFKNQAGIFSDKTLDDLVEYQKNADNGHRYDVLDHVQRFVLSLEGKRFSYKQTVYTYLKSFFAHNRAELPRDTCFRIRSDVEKVSGALTVEDLRKIVLSCDRMHQAIFLSMFQAGLGRAEFHYWNEHGWPALREALEREDQIIKIDLPSRKQSRNTKPFYSFIGSDAIRAIRSYLPERNRGAEAIFVNDDGEALGRQGVYYYWLLHLKRLGLAGLDSKKSDTGHRTGRNLHELRDLFKTQFSKSPAKLLVGDYCLGHSIDDLEYDKSFRDVALFRGEYAKALPFLQIMSSGRPFHQVAEEEVENLRAKIQTLESRLREVEDIRRDSSRK